MFAKLLLLFILVPIAELYLFLTLGAKIGIGPTLAIIVLTAIVGAWLTRSQGARAVARFQSALAEGRLPHREALDGILILLAGAVLLTPGFLTDAVGFLLLVPPARAFIRSRLAHYLKRRVQVVTPPPGAADPSPRRNGDEFIDV